MKAGVYQDICALEGVDCWVPDRETQAMLTTLIYDQIKAGQPGDETLFAKVAAAARAAGCDGAVLGCTELSVYRERHPLHRFFIDAMEVLVEACVSACGKPLTEDKP